MKFRFWMNAKLLLALAIGFVATLGAMRSSKAACAEWEFIDSASGHVIRFSGYIDMPDYGRLPSSIVLGAAPEDTEGYVSLSDLKIDQKDDSGSYISGKILNLHTEGGPYLALGGMFKPSQEKGPWSLWLSSRDTGYYVYIIVNPLPPIAPRGKSPCNEKSGE